MFSSGEYLEKIKKKNNKFYCPTFSGYNTNGAIDSGTIMMDRKIINNMKDKKRPIEKLRRHNCEIKAMKAIEQAKADAKACPIIFRIKNNELQMKATDYFLSTYSTPIYLKGIYGLILYDGHIGDFVNNNWSYASDIGQLNVNVSKSKEKDMYEITNEYTTITKNCTSTMISCNIDKPLPIYVFVSKKIREKNDVIKISNQLLWRWQTN
tara:strand:+ start:7820 stop:8446 length:627 start_codon:yes stop_codon:yes gene_type:complete